MSAKPKLVLIDGANYAFRAYHALPRLSNSAGMATNALFGFAQLLARYNRELRPDYIAVVWDARAPSWRKLRYPEYKAQRKPMDPDLRAQMPYFETLTHAFNIPYLVVDGVEADDVIATLALRHRSEVDVTILSTDKDLMQIVGDGIVLEDGIRSRIYDPDAVLKRWGVPPEQLRHLLALMGDSSDNVPGVPGVGPKRAATLVNDYGTVEEVLAHIDDVKGKKLKENLRENADQARLSLELVTLTTDVDVGVTLKEMALEEPDAGKCSKLFSELEFYALLQKYGLGDEKKSTALSVDETPSWGDIKTLLKSETPRALALEAGQGDEPPARIALAVKGEPVRIIEPGKTAPWDAIAPALRASLARDRLWVGYQLKADVAALWRAGLGRADEPLQMGIPAGDALLAAYVTGVSRSSLKLEDLAGGLLSVKLDDDETSPQSVARRADAINQLNAQFTAEVDTNEQTALLTDMELPVSAVLARMEWAGVRLDIDCLAGISREVDADLTALDAECCELSGRDDFNPNSPKQLRAVLFEDLGLRVIKRTKTGPSTDQSVLEVLASEHPLPEKILAFRSLAKLKNTYLDVLPGLVHPETGRIHTTFNQAVAATGRLSSSDPNLQNIPIRTPLGRRIREAFVAADGCKLMAADYSQIELRLMAHLSEDVILTDAFHQGDDIHARTASEIYRTPRAEVQPEQRRGAKAINFGVIYGMGAHRLARDLGIPRKEAQAFIDQYFETFSGVRAWLDSTIEQARTDGYVSTIEGRRRYLPEIHAKQFNVRANAERMATNAPLQGSAADLIKIAMIRIDRRLCEEGLSTRMLLQVHDELLFEVPEGELETAKKLVTEEMEGVRSLRVPLVVDVGIGDNWAQAH